MAKRTNQMATAGIPQAKPGAPVPDKKVGSKGAPNIFNAPAYAGLGAVMRKMFGRMDWKALESYQARAKAEKQAKAARFLARAA